MKTYSILSLILIITLGSCSTVRVASDYDKQVSFENYKTFAFYKPGIDKAEISDLDKKRILRAIEASMMNKGYTKSDNPDVLVSIFAKTQKNVNIYQNNIGWGYGWGWNPWYWGTHYNTVSTSTQGTLYIDLIDAKNKELIWQGVGSSVLAQSIDKKQEKINTIVNAILKKYPPQNN